MLYQTIGSIDVGTCVTSKFDILEEQMKDLENKFIALGNAFKQFTISKKELSYFDSLMNYIENNRLESEDSNGPIY